MIDPILDNVVIKKQKPEDRTAGGLHIPETAQPQTRAIIGEVLKVGPGDRNEHNEVITMPFAVRQGVVVVVTARHRGAEVTIKGETYLVVPVGDVLGVVE